jgi:hypothetical protein
MRHLQTYYKRNREGLVLLGLNTADRKDVTVEFLRDQGATFPNILDASDAANKVVGKLGSSAVPLSVIVDREGKVVEAWYGYREGHPRAKELLKRLGINIRPRLSGFDDEAESRSNLRQIYTALILYRMEKGKNRFFPRKKGEEFLLDLFKQGYIEKRETLISPASGTPAEAGKPVQTDYTGIDNRKESSSNIRALRMKKVPANTIPLVWEKKPLHKGKRLVLFLDGHIEAVPEKQFQDQYKKYEKGD